MRRGGSRLVEDDRDVVYRRNDGQDGGDTDRFTTATFRGETNDSVVVGTLQHVTTMTVHQNKRCIDDDILSVGS